MIVGILGGKGSGKTTVAKYLERFYGAKSYAIADELKALLKNMFDLRDEQLYGTQEEKEKIDPRWGLSPRQLMERQGDALRKVYGVQFQVNRVIDQIRVSDTSFAVVSDVRYPVEAARIGLFGTLWRLHYAPGLKRYPITHHSEAGWMTPAVDLEILPTRSGVDELSNVVDGACKIFGIAREKGSL